MTKDWWGGLEIAMVVLLLFSIYFVPVMISDVRDIRKIKQHLHLTRIQLSNYLTAELVTAQRWIQKSYEHNFPKRKQASIENQYPELVHKEGDIAWVGLINIRAIIVTGNTVSLHCSEVPWNSDSVRVEGKFPWGEKMQLCLQISFPNNIFDGVNSFIEILSRIIPLETPFSLIQEFRGEDPITRVHKVYLRKNNPSTTP